MDDWLLDVFCVCLNIVFYMENSYIVCEGELVEDMVFIMRGKFISIIIYGG